MYGIIITINGGIDLHSVYKASIEVVFMLLPTLIMCLSNYIWCNYLAHIDLSCVKIGKTYHAMTEDRLQAHLLSGVARNEGTQLSVDASLEFNNQNRSLDTVVRVSTNVPLTKNVGICKTSYYLPKPEVNSENSNNDTHTSEKKCEDKGGFFSFISSCYAYVSGVFSYVYHSMYHAMYPGEARALYNEIRVHVYGENLIGKHIYNSIYNSSVFDKQLLSVRYPRNY